MSKVRSITMSRDFVAGSDQSEQDALGVAGMELHRWLVPLAAFRRTHDETGGEVNAGTPVVEGWFENVGATVMGATCSEAGHHESTTARTVTIREGGTINAPALAAMFEQIVATTGPVAGAS